MSRTLTIFVPSATEARLCGLAQELERPVEEIASAAVAEAALDYYCGRGDAPAAETSPVPTYKCSSAVRDVANERERQVTEEAFGARHDELHPRGTLALAGAAYAYSYSTRHLGKHPEQPEWWPLSRQWWKPDRTRRMLVKAAALIIAEIDKIDRSKGGAS